MPVVKENNSFMMVDPLINSQFGPYRIEEMLGSGGMAVVYKAFDTKRNRTVALKVLYSAWVTMRDVAQRFQTEAEIARRLQHPCIVPVVGFGALQGRPYLAMEYMSGGTLSERFENPAPIGSQEVVRLLRRVSSALDYAHRQGVIHRDLKLENILLDGRADAYLTDFGIARINDASRMTATGSVIGTPLYMSPEQASGRKDIDARADLYSLAVMAYLLTVGHFPFTGNNPMAILNQHLMAAPPKPSEIQPGLSPAVDTVLLKGLSKRPEERYPSADAFVEAYAQAMSKTEQRMTMIDIRPDSGSPHGVSKEQNGATSGKPSPAISADDWYEQARQAPDRDTAIAFLKKALALDPWHSKANRALMRMEGARPSTPSQKPADREASQPKPLPVMERKVRPTSFQRREQRRKVWTRLGWISFFIMAFACSLFTLNLVGIFPGFITFVSTALGGPTPVAQVNGTPIKDIPNAVEKVPPSQSKEAQEKMVDVLENGYSHEYTFSGKPGDEVAVYVQFMSLSAKAVSRNVAIIAPNNQNVVSTCERDRILQGADSNVTFTCQLAQQGIYRVRVLGRTGESVGAYFVGVQKLNL